jgi:hypothetical protein
MKQARDVLVVLDLSACVVVDPKKLQHCLDTSQKASDEGGPSPRLDGLLETLDRVLLAHVTSDPFVDELAGTSALLRTLARADVPTFGLATFAPAVIGAITKRFGWELSFGTAHATSPMWTAAALAADLAGYRPEQVAFVSDDPWELGQAASHGCGLPILVSSRSRQDALEHERSRQDAAPGILHAPSMHDVGRIVKACTRSMALPAPTLRTVRERLPSLASIDAV